MENYLLTDLIGNYKWPPKLNQMPKKILLLAITARINPKPNMNSHTRKPNSNSIFSSALEEK